MKAILLTCITFITVPALHAQLKPVPDSTRKLLTVEASCGSCNFGMKGKGCSLAVRVEGKSYFVDGTTIDDNGDPHESDGFCEAIRKAEVQGEIVADRFRVTYFKLLPVKKAEPTRQ